MVLPREATKGQALRGGQVLAGQDADGKAVGVVVMAAYEPVYQVTCHTPKELARLAFHLGNRHTPLQLLDEEQSDHGMHYSLRIRVDSVLKDMLHGLDAHIHEALQPFEPESGAYAQTTHEHDHAHDSHAHDSHEHGHEGHVHTAECGHDHAPPADEATTLAQRDDPVHIVRIHRPGQAPIERAIKGPGHHSH